jgi:hypothetical protein
MPNIEHLPPPNLLANRSSRAAQRRSRNAEYGMGVVQYQTVMRIATVQGDGIVQSEKMREVDRVTQAAMNGQALLAKWRDTLAGADPMLHDELKFFTDVARMGKGEIILDTISNLRRL